MINYWLWVNSGEMDIGDDISESEEDVWNGCDQKTSKGDKVLIYRTSPYKHIKYLAEVLKDAEEEEIWTQRGNKIGFTCKFRILKSFKNPLKINQMRDSNGLKDWYPLKMSFIRMVFKIETEYWDVLRKIIIAKNPESMDFFNTN